MIVNSQPCNPSPQWQQQRCISINQQNSIYGSELANKTAANMFNQFRPNHMFDLATLQQEPQQHHQPQATNSDNFFDSAYDETTNSLATLANNFNQNDHLQTSQQAKMLNSNNASHKQHQTADASLYSPSSSTSLLYHHYDQINVPNEQVSNQNNNHLKRNNATTVLNPSNLFGQTTIQHTIQPQQAVASSQQHFNKTTINQQELYASRPQYHLHQWSMNTLHQQPAHLGGASYSHENHQQMLDTILRHQHATTMSRVDQLGGYHNRPVSSSGASSMSGQSTALTYGRQPRQAGAQLPPLPPINNPSKSQSTLASVLQSNQTLNHLGLGLSSQLTPNKLSHHHHQFHSSVGGLNHSAGAASRKWKRAQQRVQNFAHAHAAALLRYSSLLILIAFSIFSIIKYTSTSSLPSPINSQLPITIVNQQDHVVQSGWPVTEQAKAGDSSTLPPDVLSSRLLIGEFVILSQNFSSFDGQRSLLADNIVKLMDQVFLSTDMRRLYSRMRVTEILPHKPNGVLVKCNIILAESITYAAQQFGIALYDSLVKSNEKLSNHPNFIIDKNSIRFNTIPDKDLASVSSELLPPGLIRPDATPEPIDLGAGKPLPDLDNLKPLSSPFGQPDDQDQGAVVWSEWSSWSSCFDKNGMCDSTRLHSRVRKCVSQHTGEKVDAGECKRRFGMLDQELEVADCTAACANSNMGPSVLSDEPHPLTPFTVPPAFLLPGLPLTRPTSAQHIVGPFDPSDGSDTYQGPGPVSSPLPVVSTQGTNSVNGQDNTGPLASATNQPAPGAIHLAEGQQMSCSNCTADHICLLQLNDKVPFCAKVRDRLDECGGWCKASDQICVPAGQNAFKCTHNSECLPNEWRCHDSACIPASKRCDGHDNCYDSSDEQFCPDKSS